MTDRVLYHYTSLGAARSAAEYGYIKRNPPLPPRYMDRRGLLPDVVYLTGDPLRSQQRWAGTPQHDVKGLAYLDRAAARIACSLDPDLGAAARRFRAWALDYNIPAAWIEEAAKGGRTDDWWVLEREVAKVEWIEVAFWNGLRYVPTFQRVLGRGGGASR